MIQIKLTRVLIRPVTAMILFLAVAATAPQYQASTARGVYTPEQAAEGRELYKAVCASCHGENLMGTFEIPPLTGRFISNWTNGSVGRLFTYISDAMPQMAPGTLGPEDNAKIVAYLLQANGLPAGRRPLPTDPAALEQIAFEAGKPLLADR